MNGETDWVDTHLHVINRSELGYGWLEEVAEPWTSFMGDYTPLTLRDYTMDEYLLQTLPTGVSKIVHIEAAFGSEPSKETAFVQKLADQKKIPIAIIGHAELDSPNIEALLDRHMENSNFRGVRMLWGTTKAETVAFRSGFAAVMRRGLSFEDPTPWQNFGNVCKLAADFPDAKIVLGHCGMPLQRDEKYLEAWHTGLKQVARYDNVVCKISGLRMTDHNWTFASVERITKTVIESFGIGRCFFGSNWPVDSLYPGSIQDFVANTRKIISSYSTTEQAAMLNGNASRFYDF